MNKPVARVDFERAMPARFTTAEFLAICDSGAFDDIKVELVDGQIYRMSPPKLPHSFYQSEMIFLLRQALGAGSGLTVLAETGITLREGTVRACDAAIVRMTGENRMLRANDVVLLIEIAATSLDEDLGGKMLDYAEAGVPNYWVIDVNGRAVHVMGQPDEGRYLARAIVRFGEVLAVPGTDKMVSVA